MRLKTSILILLIFCSACGLYKAPLAPERFAPQQVKQLQVSATDTGMSFAWVSPDKDLQGEKLKYIDGYSVRRQGPASSFNQLIELTFEEIGFIKDEHLIIEKKLKDNAIEKGEISRRTEAPAETKQFGFIDESLQPDYFYAYLVTPINQGGVEGRESELIQVKFDGSNSRILSIVSQLNTQEQEESTSQGASNDDSR